MIKSRLLDKSGAFSIKLDELMIELNSRVNLEFKDYKKSVIGRSIDEIVEKQKLKVLNALMLRGRVEESAKSVLRSK